MAASFLIVANGEFLSGFCYFMSWFIDVSSCCQFGLIVIVVGLLVVGSENQHSLSILSYLTPIKWTTYYKLMYSRLSEMKYLLLEALVEDAAWAAAPNDRSVALPEIPLDLDPFLSSLDVQVGGFITPPSWDIGDNSLFNIWVASSNKSLRLCIQPGRRSSAAESRSLSFVLSFHGERRYVRIRIAKLDTPWLY